MVVVAAAGNHGVDRPHIAFPASMRNVICMRAMDGEGKDCSFNAWGQNAGDDYFHTLGEEVLSMWTTYVQHPSGPFVLEKRASGTSVATPVAAGIAALILDFVRQRDLHDQRKFLAEARKIISNSPSEKMRVIFHAMSPKKEGAGAQWRYLAPWRLLWSDDRRLKGDWTGNAERIYSALSDRPLHSPGGDRRSSVPEAVNMVEETDT